MLGRAAHGSPWIFRDVNSFLETGKNSAPLLRAEIRDIILEHITALYAFHGEAAGVRIARKHLGWYSKGLHGASDLRQRLFQIESVAEAEAIFLEYLDPVAYVA